MNFNLTVGVTPELAKLLEGLTQALQGVQTHSTPVQEAQPQQEQTQVPPVSVVPTTPEPVPNAPIQEQQAPAQTPSAVPTAGQTYTMDQLAAASTQLVDQGRREELLELLTSFGVQALTMLPQEQYGVFATKLREKGAKI